MTKATDPDNYPDSAAYRESFTEWLNPGNGTHPDHLAEAQANSAGYVPMWYVNPTVCDPVDWSEYVFNSLHDQTREALVDHLMKVMGDTFRGLPGYDDDATAWAWGNHETELEDAIAGGWVQR